MHRLSAGEQPRSEQQQQQQQTTNIRCDRGVQYDATGCAPTGCDVRLAIQPLSAQQQRVTFFTSAATPLHALRMITVRDQHPDQRQHCHRSLERAFAAMCPTERSELTTELELHCQVEQMMPAAAGWHQDLHRLMHAKLFTALSCTPAARIDMHVEVGVVRGGGFGAGWHQDSLLRGGRIFDYVAVRCPGGCRCAEF